MFVVSRSVLALPSTQLPGAPPASPPPSLGGNRPSLSSRYVSQPTVNCLRLLRQATSYALVLARERTGSSMAARIAIMAITTRSSIRVNARNGGTPRIGESREFRSPKTQPRQSVPLVPPDSVRAFTLRGWSSRPSSCLNRSLGRTLHAPGNGWDLGFLPRPYSYCNRAWNFCQAPKRVGKSRQTVTDRQGRTIK